jgi:hypothetical protein
VDVVAASFTKVRLIGSSEYGAITLLHFNTWSQSQSIHRSSFGGCLANRLITSAARYEVNKSAAGGKSAMIAKSEGD